MQFYGKQLSSLQRRSIKICGANLVLIAFIELTWIDLAKDSPHLALVYLFAILPAIPVIAIIVTVSRYLVRETDEFIRTLVVQAMLWSFGVIMVVDTALGILLRSSPGLRLLPMLNIDLFCVVTPLALRVQLWRSR